MAKHTLILRDTSLDEILEFLDRAEEFGKEVPSVIGPQVEASGVDADGNEIENQTPANVTYEARQLKNLFLKLKDST